MTDARDQRKAALLAEQQTLRQRLANLQMEKAKQGIRAKPALLIEIEDAQRRLSEIAFQLHVLETQQGQDL